MGFELPYGPLRWKDEVGSSGSAPFAYVGDGGSIEDGRISSIGVHMDAHISGGRSSRRIIAVGVINGER